MVVDCSKYPTPNVVKKEGTRDKRVLCRNSGITYNSRHAN